MEWVIQALPAQRAEQKQEVYGQKTLRAPDFERAEHGSHDFGRGRRRVASVRNGRCSTS